MTNRRRFLESLAAAGAASLVPSSGVFGLQRRVKLNVRGGAIDIHHHFVPPGGTTNRPWSPQMSLEQRILRGNAERLFPRFKAA